MLEGFLAGYMAKVGGSPLVDGGFTDGVLGGSEPCTHRQ